MFRKGKSISPLSHLQGLKNQLQAAEAQKYLNVSTELHAAMV